MTNIDLFENLLLVFGSPILAYAVLTIFILFVMLKSSVSIRLTILFLTLWTLFFAFNLGLTYLAVAILIIFGIVVIGIIFNWIR